MLIKRILLSVFVLLVLCLVIRVLIIGLQPEVLPVGSIMPTITFEDKLGSQVLKTDSVHKTMIVCFNSDCEHCMYELNVINDNYQKFKNINIYLLTAEENFNTRDYLNKFTRFKKANNVKWGSINNNEFKNKLGGFGVPYILIFDKYGVLLNKITGEIKLTKLLEEFSGSGTLSKRYN
ncbi:MAG: hypothetical protein R6V04_09385 [bacterium]